MDKRWFVGLAALALVGVLPATSLAAGADPVGMVLQAKGSAMLVRDGAGQQLRLADTLLVGDEIAAGDGSVVFLFCPASQTWTMAAGARVRLGAESVQSLEGPAPENRSVRRCAIPQVALGGESLERVGGLRARGYPPVILYLGGAVSTSRPVFEWENLENASEYEVVLKNDLGAEVWKTAVSSTPLAYPESAPELKPGFYAWEVTARADGQTVGQQLARFQVKPSEELKAEDAGAPELLRATALENAGYYAEAASLYRSLREENPSDEQRLTRRLAWLYWNSGLISAANQERARLGEDR